jgi:uncharacterized protein YeaO (DUF488 family)
MRLRSLIQALTMAEFCRHYFAELKESPDMWAPIASTSEKGAVTLICGSRTLLLHHQKPEKE